MIIGVDLDDTLASCIKYFLDFYNDKHSTEFIIDDVKAYGLWEIFGCSKESVMDDIAEFYAHPDFDNMTPIEGSVQAIQRLAEEHDIYVITARPSYLEDKIRNRIESNYGSCFRDIILTNQVFEKDDARKKSDICNDLGAKLMIEDSVSHAYDCVSEGIDVFLMDMPWNQSYNADDKITRVYSWKDIEKEINLG
ncbi:MAG: hypothetical protein U9R34_04345 [Nanoarchaeota archaeon]|nr:hypothetical protein [Nanoarchaeota archaeon]